MPVSVLTMKKYSLNQKEPMTSYPGKKMQLINQPLSLAQFGVRLLITSLILSAAFVTAARATTLLDPRPEPATEQFGRAIAVIGDVDNDGVPDLAVGAPFQDGDFIGQPGFGKPQNPGKVWMLSGATLTVLFTMDDPKYQVEGADPQFGPQLGFSVSRIGDINNDGIPDVIAGAPHEVPGDFSGGTGIINAGRAFAFSGADGSVLLTLDDPEQQEGGLLGYAVAGLGDVNGDGVPDMAVGVPGKNIPDEESPAIGLVYIFNGADGSLIRTLNHPTQEVNARFGSAVANAGDIDHDGVTDVLIGAPGRSEAFVFSGRTGALIFSIASPVIEHEPSFGAAVAGGRDLDGDGTPDFAVGAPLLKNSQGGVFVYNGSDGTLRRKLRVRSPQQFARFGAAIYFSDDLNGDGRPDILVGVPDQDVNGQLNAGEVLFFNGANGKLFQTLTSGQPQDSAGFGSAIVTADFNGDGTPTPVVGTPYESADIIENGDSNHHIAIGQIEIQ
jgi:VCBS repeat protein/FG-GAP repeat protein